MGSRRDLSAFAAFAATVFFLLGFIGAAVLLARAERQTRHIAESTASLLSSSVLATMELPAPASTREEALARLNKHWAAIRASKTDAFLCVVDDRGTLLEHTRNPERRGRNMGRAVVETDDGPRPMSDLVESHQPWSGILEGASGERQFLVAGPSVPIGGDIIIHAPIDPDARGTARWLLPLLGAASLFSAGLAWRLSARRVSSAEAAEARSDAEFRELAESLPQIIYLKDDSTGQFLFVNGAIERILGIPRDRVLSDAAGMAKVLIHPDDRAKVLPLLAAPSNSISAVEYRTIAADGSVRYMRHTRVPVVVDGRSTGRSAGSIEDVTIERRAANAMASLSGLIDASPDPMTVVRDGVIRYANSAACEATGMSAAELAGTNVLELIHPDDRGRIVTLLAGITPGVPTPDVEVRVVRPKGPPLDAEVRGVAVEFEGQPGFLLVGRDITARKQLATQAALQDRLATVGALAAGVAHEINNPLTWVISNLTTLARDIDQLAPSAPAPALAGLREQLADASRGAIRVKEIVHDLRAFARTEEDRVGTIDVEDSVDLALNMCSNEIKYRAALIRERSTNVLVKANEGKLSQTILNLLVNAAQAIPEGQAARNWIRVRTRVEGNDVVLEIADSGVGIAPDVLPRIFDPFFTTKAAGVGSGLGLPISRSIVEGLGGSLSVESTPGTGTTFRVRLPLAQAPQVAAPSPPPTTATKRARILVVDDEPLIASAIRSLLPEHEVSGETSVHRARERIASGETFDLVLCDLVMPDETGPEFDAWLRANAPALAGRIRYMTGGAFTRQTREFAFTLGENVLHKPFDELALRHVVAATIGA